MDFDHRTDIPDHEHRWRRYRRHLHRPGRLRRRPHRHLEMLDRAGRSDPRRGRKPRAGPLRDAGAVGAAARLDHRHQHRAGAQGRAHRADHHARLPRHLRDRPRQPDRGVQSVLPSAEAADPARTDLRGQRADECQGRGADAAGREPRCRRWRSRLPRRASRRSRCASCTPTPIRRTSGASAKSCARRIRSCSSRCRTRSCANIANTSAPRPPRSTPSSARACRPISAGWKAICATRSFPARSTSCARTAA